MIAAFWWTCWCFAAAGAAEVLLWECLGPAAPGFVDEVLEEDVLVLDVLDEVLVELCAGCRSFASRLRLGAAAVLAAAVPARVPFFAP